MEKKNIALILLVIALGGSGVGNIILVMTSGQVPPELNTLRYASSEAGAPAVLDPVDAWDSQSLQVVRHVCDNLWVYDLYDPDYAIIPSLATSWEYNVAKDEVEVILRENVYFHDGSYFNATAVQYTMTRINYFANATGTLPNTTHVCDPGFLLYSLQNVPIINKTVINSEYNITVFLNDPNAIFIPLMAYEGWAILHPDSSSATEYMELGTDILIGTGPFEYEHFIEGEEMKYVRNEMYWGPTTFWDEVVIVYYPDSVTAANAMLGGEVDAGGFLTSMIDLFIDDDEITFTNLETSAVFRYFGLNNRKINDTNVRKAIAYAYNYTYFIEVVRLGYAIRAHQFVPPGFPYYNASFRAPYMNVTIAREAMMLAEPVKTAGLTSQGWKVNTTNDANWAALDLYTFKILEHEGWTTGIEMNEAFAADVDRIGISVVPDVMDWELYIATTTNNEDRLEIWYTGWAPDYLDPFNMVAPLLSNLSTANSLQMNDPDINQWLEDYEVETDPDQKGVLLYQIQNRALNVIYAKLAVSYDMNMYVYHVSVGNPCLNTQGRTWWTDSYFIPGVARAG